MAWANVFDCTYEQAYNYMAKFCKKHNQGRYYVLVRVHALCVKDGVAYDWKGGGRRQVHFAARVRLENEL